MRERERPVHGSRYADASITNKPCSRKGDPWGVWFSSNCLWVVFSRKWMFLRNVWKWWSWLPRSSCLALKCYESGTARLLQKRPREKMWKQRPSPGISSVFLRAHRFPHGSVCVISVYMTALPTRHWPSPKYCGDINANFQGEATSLNEKEDCSQSATILIPELYRKVWHPWLTRLPKERVTFFSGGNLWGHFNNLGIGHVPNIYCHLGRNVPKALKLTPNRLPLTAPVLVYLIHFLIFKGIVLLSTHRKASTQLLFSGCEFQIRSVWIYWNCITDWISSFYNIP